MQINDFKSTVTTFADPGTELLFDKAQVVLSVNGDLITAAISTQSGDVYVDEGSGAEPASKWILNRLARLPLLAARLRESVALTKYFVSPAAILLPTLENGPQENLLSTEDALSATLQSLDDRSPLETTVLYVTSDAGEGKTSLINQMARTQAQRFSENKADWLLVPIQLGGRHFLRFDDITVGVLQNRYRFPFLYYQSFLALVRMGVLVPAFDGFEEMFVESNSGEALSAMGILVGSLESRGAMVVAARKAYFEFENLRMQERLFDTIRTSAVGFGKLALSRWSKSQFVAYCEKREVKSPHDLYRRVSERLTPNHALLTRAVLVKRLVDVALASASLDNFLQQLDQAGPDFFSVFVRGLIEREANEKWIDRSGEKEVGTPLLTVSEHCELLSQVALAMWDSRVDFLKQDLLEFVGDDFCEANRKSAFQSQQVRQRLRGHAMLIPSSNAVGAVEFDHDEFRLFFLGEGISRLLMLLNDRARADVLGAFRRDVLPGQAQHALVQAILRNATIDRVQVARFLLSISSMDAQASYTQENCCELILRLLSRLDGSGLVIANLAFGPDAFRDRSLTNLIFRDCYFAPASFETSEIKECSFTKCQFAEIRLFDSSVLKQISFDDCKVDSLELVDQHREIWSPSEIRHLLSERGISYASSDSLPVVAVNQIESEAEIHDIEKIVRYFMRSTHMSESVMLMKLGARGQGFLSDTIPRLMKNGIMQEIENRGAGDQKRFALGVTLQAINDAIARSQGSFRAFLEAFSQKP